ncbi:MAG: glycosyltransferase family 39 protein [Chloroflexi bacterium]|nr:glycosyltransferase family 39 protein [Chloroflexota bacterium]
MSIRIATRHALVAIVMSYFVLGVLYAVFTPLWEAPDEPAHFNYVKYITENSRLPVLQVGDYDQSYLKAIVSRQFPPGMSIDPLRYESHQPPLYYLLTAPLYQLTDSVLVLRVFSVVLGALLILVAYGVAATIFPTDTFMPLATAAGVAFVPQHVAMTAAVNNDALAELLLALVIWQSLRIMNGRNRRQECLALGFLIGLCLLTKTTAYVAIPLALCAILLTPGSVAPGRRRRLVQVLSWIFLPALLLAGPWLVRNALVYGANDLLALGRHSQVVTGQPRTAEWLAQYGMQGYLSRFALTTFRSFWAQFGWMGVLVDERIYIALALTSAAMMGGLAFFLARACHEPNLLSDSQRRALVLLLLSIMFTAIAYLWYNLGFVQHQGRYLFPALTALSIFGALGAREVLRPKPARMIAALGCMTVAVLALWGMARDDIGGWAIAMLGGLSVGFAVISALPERARPVVLGLGYLALAVLDVVCLFGFVVPAFA